MSTLQYSNQTTDIKEIYKDIRNYLAGRFVGVSRDSAIFDEVSKCLFTYVFIKKNNSKLLSKISLIDFRDNFEKIKKILPDVFNKGDKINLNNETFVYICKQLSKINFDNYDTDPVSDLYETFASSFLKETEGQFFTPLNTVNWLVDILGPKNDDLVIDPACGSGSFLSVVAKYKLKNGCKPEIIGKTIYGIDKDKLLTKLTQAHISISTMTKANIICGDSLSLEMENNKTINKNLIGKFDIILSNPPFGKKIISTSDSIRKNFDLGFKWTENKKEETWYKSNLLHKNVPPQVLFLERIISLAKDDGKIGVVIPESLLSNQSYKHVVQFLKSKLLINCVIGMPENLFKFSGKGGTHTKTCLLVATKNNRLNKNKNKYIYIAEAKWCGNDSRGKKILKDDLPAIKKDYKNFILEKKITFGSKIPHSKIINNILCPRYYQPELDIEFKKLSQTHELLNIGDLISKNVLSLSLGNEIGKISYGSGLIPFIRTSDISNWEIKFDPKHCVDEKIYDELKKKQDVKENDILFVKDGTYLIGNCALISKYDTKIIFQSHLYKIRCNDWKILSPYLFLASISSDIVIRQIQSKRFTQDIIDTIGKRIYELILPIPKDQKKRLYIENLVKKSINERIEAKELSKKAISQIC